MNGSSGPWVDFIVLDWVVTDTLCVVLLFPVLSFSFLSIAALFRLTLKFQPVCNENKRGGGKDYFTSTGKHQWRRAPAWMRVGLEFNSSSSAAKSSMALIISHVMYVLALSTTIKISKG